LSITFSGIAVAVGGTGVGGVVGVTLIAVAVGGTSVGGVVGAILVAGAVVGATVVAGAHALKISERLNKITKILFAFISYLLIYSSNCG
jgi:hypothetical protein